MAGGRIWTTRQQAAAYTGHFRDGVYAPELHIYLAVGDGEGLFTSPDGIDWTAQTLSATADVLGATWTRGLSPGRFIIVGGDFAYTSDDGAVTWALRSFDGSPDGMKAVRWDSVRQQAVAVGDSGASSPFIQTSPDGVTWTNRSPSVGDITALAVADGGSYVAVGYRTIFESSDGGVTWTDRVFEGAFNSTIAACAWSPQLRLFAACGAGGEMHTSPDGITWTAQTSNTGQDLHSLTWSAVGELFLATGAAGTLLTSPDGEVWTSRVGALPLPSTFYGSFAGPDKLVALADTGEIQTSEAVTILTQHSENFRKLLPPGAAFGN